MSSALLRRGLLQFMSCCSKTMQGAARNYPGCRKRLERRGDVALYRSCVAMRPCNTNIFGGGGVEWIQETQLDDANISPIVFLRY